MKKFNKLQRFYINVKHNVEKLSNTIFTYMLRSKYDFDYLIYLDQANTFHKICTQLVGHICSTVTYE